MQINPLFWKTINPRINYPWIIFKTLLLLTYYIVLSNEWISINPRVRYPWVVCNPTSKLFSHKPPTQTIVKRLPANPHSPEVHRLFGHVLFLVRLIFQYSNSLFSPDLIKKREFDWMKFDWSVNLLWAKSLEILWEYIWSKPTITTPKTSFL